MSDILDIGPPVNTATCPQLVITLNPGQGVQLAGPLHDPILVLGMLEMAKQSFFEYMKQKTSESRIQPVQIMPQFRK